MFSTLVVAHISRVLHHFTTSCACQRFSCLPKLLAVLCILLQTSHAFILPCFISQGDCPAGQYLFGIFKLGNLQLVIALNLGVVKKNFIWEKLLFIWENWERLCALL